MGNIFNLPSAEFVYRLVKILVNENWYMKVRAGHHSTLGSASECKASGRYFESQLDHITLLEVDHETFLWWFAPSYHSRRAVVSYWQKYLHMYWLTTRNRTSLPRKSLRRFTDLLSMAISVFTGP